MATKTFSSIAAFARQFVKDTKDRERRVKNARRGAARFGARYVITETVPKAFEELADSVHIDVVGDELQVVADAPHAGAVENGSRPHVPPLEPLIAWVKLRGMQGLTSSGNVIKNRTRTGLVKNRNLEAARVVADALRGKERRGDTPSARGALGVDAARAVAFAIQQAIAKRGTRPFRFMQKAVEPTRDMLQTLVEVAIRDDQE